LTGRIVIFAKRYATAAIYSVFLFTLGLFSRRRRDHIATIAGLTRRVPESSPTILPMVTVDDLVAQPQAVTICHAEARDGNVSLLELVLINQLVAGRRPMRLFEIGTFDGRTTLNMACNAPPEAVVMTLDLPRDLIDQTALPIEDRERMHIDKPGSGELFRGHRVEERILQLHGDSARFDFTLYLGTLDLVFIDGSHHHDYVRNDTRIARQLLRPRGGMILWHDYGVFDGVTQVLNELYQLDPEPYRGLVHVHGTSLVCLCLHADSGLEGQRRTEP